MPITGHRSPITTPWLDPVHHADHHHAGRVGIHRPRKRSGLILGGALKLCLRLTHRRLVRYWLSSNCSFAGGHSDVVARPPAFSMCFIAGELNRKE
jgi:hypothetical protein